jgi:hypothetical protein
MQGATGKKAAWRIRRVSRAVLLCVAAAAGALHAQAPVANDRKPIAIVPLESSGATVTGPIEARNGQAFITSTGEIAAGPQTVAVTLPQRGALNVCAHTSVRLSVDTSVKAADVPGLMIGLSAGALETSFAVVRNSDIVQTPDFRILISGPGSGDVKVRLGTKGDTCVDNGVGRQNANAPYVLVSSVFEGGAYRVQSGQRVMFQHGSLREVVDNEKEACGCPPATTSGNEFPLAESMGLKPPAKTADVAVNPDAENQAQDVPPLVYNAGDHSGEAAVQAKADSAAKAASVPAADEKKLGFFTKVGRFLKHLFGAE